MIGIEGANLEGPEHFHSWWRLTRKAGDGEKEAWLWTSDGKGEFTIEAAPIDEDGKFRTARFISGELDGEIKRIRYIRADQNTSRDTAIEHSISKAQQIIDEQGAKLLEKTHL